MIEEKYHCGDLCPDHGIFFLAYKDVELAYTSIESDQCAASAVIKCSRQIGALGT